MNYFNFTLSGKRFIYAYILNDTFAGQSPLGCRFLLFITLNTSSQSLLACKVSFEKSANSLMETPQQLTLCFSLAAFKILCLSLTLVNLMMCLGVFLFVSNFFGTLWASWTYMSISFTMLGSFLSLFFQISFQFLVLSCLLPAPL